MAIIIYLQQKLYYANKREHTKKTFHNLLYHYYIYIYSDEDDYCGNAHLGLKDRVMNRRCFASSFNLKRIKVECCGAELHVALFYITEFLEVWSCLSNFSVISSYTNSLPLYC